MPNVISIVIVQSVVRSQPVNLVTLYPVTRYIKITGRVPYPTWQPVNTLSTTFPMKETRELIGSLVGDAQDRAVNREA